MIIYAVNNNMEIVTLLILNNNLVKQIILALWLCCLVTLIHAVLLYVLVPYSIKHNIICRFPHTYAVWTNADFNVAIKCFFKLCGSRGGVLSDGLAILVSLHFFLQLLLILSDLALTDCPWIQIFKPTMIGNFRNRWNEDFQSSTSPNPNPDWNL